MAAISYWFLSPSVILALIGKLKGWDRTKPTPTFDWKTATLDVVIPAGTRDGQTLRLRGKGGAGGGESPGKK